MKMVENSLKGWKALWEKEKFLAMSNFSFFHRVFKRLVLQTLKNTGLFLEKRYTLKVYQIAKFHLNPNRNYLHMTLLQAKKLSLSLGFTCLQKNSFENTVVKGEIAPKEQFLLSPTMLDLP